MNIGQILQARRLQLGFTLEQVAEQTRIPLTHLEAVENERWQDLPDGPYQQAYIKAYAKHMGVKLVPRKLKSEQGDETELVAAPAMARWPLAVLAASAVTMGVLLWQSQPSLPVVSVEQPDQHVKIVARRNTALRVLVDEKLVFDSRLPGGRHLEVTGHDRVVVELPAAENARVIYNGDALVPQGRQDQPRRLVFIDDTEPPHVVRSAPEQVAGLLKAPTKRE